MAMQFKCELIIFAFVILGWTSYCSGQTPQQMPVPSPERRGIASAGEQLPGQKLPGSISGTIVDQSGAVVVGARVRLTGAKFDSGGLISWKVFGRCTLKAYKDWELAS